MKAVCRSIKLYWLYLILIGEKTVEVGKDFPKSEDWNKEVYLYGSKDKKSFNRIPEKDRGWMRKYIGKVACRFVCDKIDTIGKRGINNNFDYCYQSLNVFGNDDIEVEITAIKKSCIPKAELNAYGAYSVCLFAWHISDLVIYDKPRELSGFYHYCGDNPKCDGCEAHYYSNTECGKEDYCCSPIEGCKPLKSPFQSWGYVYEADT